MKKFYKPMSRIHFHPDEAVIFRSKFWAGFKFKVPSGLAPVDASGNPSHSFSLPFYKNCLKKFFFILYNIKLGNVILF
jgi:hypothetical protein